MGTAIVNMLKPILSLRTSVRLRLGTTPVFTMSLPACSVAVLAASMQLSGCHTTAARVTGGVVATTILGSRAVGSEMQQTYYLGVLDPQGQIPPQIYRLRVHGQGSVLGFTKFASGWVPAPIADSLGSRMEFEKDTANTNITAASSDTASNITAGRRLVMFGPEGFREAPKGHRLVIVMGSNPNAYFKGIEDALGNIAVVTAKQKDQALSEDLFKSLIKLNTERDSLSSMSKDLDLDIPPPGSGSP